MKHRMKKIIFFIALVILYAYICALLNIPNRVILMQGETLQMKTLLGISITKNLTQDSQETNICFFIRCFARYFRFSHYQHALRIQFHANVLLQDMALWILIHKNLFKLQKAISLQPKYYPSKKGKKVTKKLLLFSLLLRQIFLISISYFWLLPSSN